MIKVGLNLGNSKISCIVTDYKNSDNINILSVLSYPSNLIKKNIIINYEKLLNEVKNLIIESEKQSQTKINSININISIVDSLSKYYQSEIFISELNVSLVDGPAIFLSKEISSNISVYVPLSCENSCKSNSLKGISLYQLASGLIY